MRDLFAKEILHCLGMADRILQHGAKAIAAFIDGKLVIPAGIEPAFTT